MAADANTVRIMLATDNHVGFAERDPVRGDDSFEAFEEVLVQARARGADFVLLGGDLFHENKPSRRAVFRTMAALRRHCLGDGAVSVQVLSEQTNCFKTGGGQVNFENPDMNVCLPVFSIHGNHDDPTRDAGSLEALAAVDLLAAANLINHFGRADRVDDVRVMPVLLQKGTTKIAIYGLGSMRDERLNRMFAQKKVTFMRPQEDPDNWFSIFVVHQNRDNRGRGSKNHVSESMIPGFIDFVLWGHEHESLPTAEQSAMGDFRVCQPGSSVATSLVEGEAKRKHIAVLDVRGTDFCCTPVPLQKVRPFLMETMSLADDVEPALDAADPHVTERITEALTERVEAMLVRAKEEFPAARCGGDPCDLPTCYCKVLLRLRVDHTGFPSISPQRFGGFLVGRVANPGEVLLFAKRRESAAAGSSASSSSSSLPASVAEALAAARQQDAAQGDSVTVEDLVSKHLQVAADKDKLQILPERGLTEALEKYVLKSEASAISDAVREVLERAQKECWAKGTSAAPDEIMAAVSESAARAREREAREKAARAKRARRAPASPVSSASSSSSASESDAGSRKRKKAPASSASASSSFSASESDAGSRKRKKAPAKKKPAKKVPAKKKPAKKKARPPSSSEEEEEEEEEEEPAPAPKRRAVRKAAAKKPIVVESSEEEVSGSEFSSAASGGDDDDDDEGEEEEVSEEEEPQPKRRRAAPQKKAAAAAKKKKSPAKKPRKKQAMLSDSESDDEPESVVNTANWGRARS